MYVCFCLLLRLILASVFVCVFAEQQLIVFSVSYVCMNLKVQSTQNDLNKGLFSYFKG